MELPDDIMLKILCNLSMKNLLQFQTVNKTWRNNINYLLLRPKLLKRSCFICVTPDDHLQVREEPYSIIYEDENGVFKVTKLRWGDPPVEESFRHGYWNRSYTHGLFCLSSPSFQIARERSSSGSTWIFNPSTRRAYLFAGFGFDSSTSKFKVVQILQEERDPSQTEALIHTVKGDIFSYSWKKLDNVPRVKLKKGGAVTINGSLYWLTSSHGILSFELASERFGFIEIPDQLKPLYDYINLYEIGGLLCVCVLHRSHQVCVELWILKQGSWTKIVIEKLWESSVKPIMISTKKEIILLWDRKRLVSYITT